MASRPARRGWGTSDIRPVPPQPNGRFRDFFGRSVGVGSLGRPASPAGRNSALSGHHALPVGGEPSRVALPKGPGSRLPPSRVTLPLGTTVQPVTTIVMIAPPPSGSTSRTWLPSSGLPLSRVALPVGSTVPSGKVG